MIVDSGWVLFTMASIFLVFGYIGVPVPFALLPMPGVPLPPGLKYCMVRITRFVPLTIFSMVTRIGPMSSFRCQLV